MVPPHVDRRRRPLEDGELGGRSGEVRHDLHGRGPGADDPDALVGQPVEVPVRLAARVVARPPARVEGPPAEGPDDRDARERGPVQRAVAHDEERRPQGVAAIGPDGPAGPIGSPLDRGDLPRQARIVGEAEVPGDTAAVLWDLGPVRVLLRRDVAGLLEQRQVDVRRDVALRTRVPVPVPRPADVAALLDDPDVVDARLLQVGTGHQAGTSAPDDGDGHVVVPGRPVLRRQVGVLEVGRERAGHLDILGAAVDAEPLVALDAVLLAVLVRVVHRSCSPHSASWPPPRRIPRSGTRTDGRVSETATYAGHDRRASERRSPWSWSMSPDR